jgi:hypothetical protein
MTHSNAWIIAGFMSAFAPAALCSQRPNAERSYAQRLVDETAARHPEMKGMELALRRGDGCITIAATDRGDVGDRCDGKEKGPLTTGDPYIEEPTRKDPAWITTQVLHDASGQAIGAIMMDIAGDASDRDAAMATPLTIRAEVEARIPSASVLSLRAPAALPLPPQDTTYRPRLDPADFVARVTNRWFPLEPGTAWRFRGTGENASETNTVTVTHDSKMILGIRATVVHDEVFEDGELVEDTYDWYAQDAAGTVWYLGEDSREMKNGRVVSTAGSWQAGVDGARPGVVMWADPASHVGAMYRQEYRPGVAEDMGKVVALRERVTVAYGAFGDCVRTEDTTPLEPAVLESKYYCSGVGLVKEIESSRAGMDLIRIDRGT